VIKAIIFDNNGVLTGLENTQVKTMAQMCGVSFDVFLRKWKEFAEPLDEGKVTTENFLIKLSNYFGNKATYIELDGIYQDCYDRNEEMHNIVRDLSKKYETALLSNFGDSFDRFEKKWRTGETIKPENIFVSVKLGMRKPNHDIYEYALSRLGIEANESIFVDDRIENVQAAESIGMRGIHFKSPEQFKNELELLIGNENA
jgi:HAD superfamily hydrolase (TIGR01509 family)